jgi:hypothetical protein
VRLLERKRVTPIDGSNMKASDSRTWGPELLAIAGLIFLAPIAVALRGGLLHALGHNATLAANLGAALMIFLASRPRAREWIAAIGLALALRALYVTLDEPVGVYPGSFLLSWCAFLGVAAILVLGARVVHDAGRRLPGIRAKLRSGLMADRPPVSHRSDDHPIRGAVYRGDGHIRVEAPAG